MRTTPLTAALSIANLGLWGVSLVDSTLKASGAHLSTLALLAASPIAVAVAAALTVVLFVWHVLMPLGIVWQVAESSGRQDAARASVTVDRSNVRELHPSS